MRECTDLETIVEKQSTGNIYSKIGEFGLWRVMLTSTPGLKKLAVPLVYRRYRKILKSSNSLKELYENHAVEWDLSSLYKFCRPLYRRASVVLRERYDIS